MEHTLKKNSTKQPKQQLTSHSDLHKDLYSTAQINFVWLGTFAWLQQRGYLHGLIQ